MVLNRVSSLTKKTRLAEPRIRQLFTFSTSRVESDRRLASTLVVQVQVKSKTEEEKNYYGYGKVFLIIQTTVIFLRSLPFTEERSLKIPSVDTVRICNLMSMRCVRRPNLGSKSSLVCFLNPRRLFRVVAVELGFKSLYETATERFGFLVRVDYLATESLSILEGSRESQ